MKKRLNDIVLICNILIPLAIGAYIYIFKDSDSYFGNFIRSVLEIPAFESGSAVEEILRNWGCDFLFAYALFFALYATSRNIPTSICYAAACAIGLELLQLIQVDFLKCGTFDIVDILIEIVAILFGTVFLICINYMKRKRGGNTYER